MSRLSKIFLYVWFYIGWFGCVYSAQINKPWLSLIFPAVMLLFCLMRTKFSKLQFVYLCLFLVIGLFFDYLAFQSGYIKFAIEDFLILPVWLFSLWILFVLTLPVMVEFFGSKLILAALFGAVFGPLSYFYGNKLNVLFVTSQTGYIIYAVFWGVYFSTTMYLLRKQK